MIPLILGLVLLAGLILLARLFTAVPARQLVGILKWSAIGLALGAGVMLLGRLNWGLGSLAAAAFALWPLLQSLGLLRNRAKTARGPSPGQHSDVETAGLRMSLDHDTGRMDGMVMDGTYRGRMLSDLGQADFPVLMAEFQTHDPESVPLLEAYLDRRFGGDWRADTDSTGPGGGREQGGAGGRSGAMTRAEALSLLGLKDGASDQDIREAHRKLMKQVHPDRGGTAELAAKINQAKDILLP